MALRLYNTLTRSIEEFKPIKPGKVSFYSCGPTVYDFAHIGNFRSFLNADVLRRTLELLGFSVTHVMNITDVGHMTDDAVADGSGEDKMQLAARRLLEAKKSGKLPPGAANVDPSDPYAIANFYADAFLEDARMLGLKVAIEAQENPKLMPRPSQCIEKMIAHIQKLLERGHAYVGRDGVVYYDVTSFPDYGRLSGNTLDQLREGEGGRVSDANQAAKKHPADFMLWKPDPKHLMRWPSPWGEGYPGWHIECSVMAASILGEEIDLHSGGEDNIFPHHECEIAQTRGVTGRAHFARYWFHTRHLIVEGAKMSKSKGNFFTPRDLLAKGASPAAIRLEIIKTHYRANANFTFQGLADSQRQIDRWGRLRDSLSSGTATPASGSARGGPLSHALEEFTAALCDDLNIAGAIGALSEAVNHYGSPDSAPRATAGELEALRRMDSVLGVLDIDRQAPKSDKLVLLHGSVSAGAQARGNPTVVDIDAKIAERNAARKAKDFKRSDAIRDELQAMGIAIKDGPQGTTWSRIVK